MISDVDRVSQINAEERRSSMRGEGLLEMDQTEAVYLVANRTGWDLFRATDAMLAWTNRRRGAGGRIGRESWW